MTGAVTIRSSELSATVAPLGAELIDLQHRGTTALLWSGDPAVWAARSPILFPVVGRVRNDRILIDGRSFPMPLHGFARHAEFGLLHRDASSCVLRLEDGPATRASYPYPFRLDLAYRVEAATLVAEASVLNPGPKTLPASFGFHPGFRWPLDPRLAKEDYCVRFPDDRVLEAHRPIETLIARQTQIVSVPDGRLRLGDHLFQAGALIFLSAASRTVVLEADQGGLAIEVSFENLPHLALWMRPGGAFICIEPWHGHSDPEGFDRDFVDKPGLDLIPPGEERTYRMRIAVRETRTQAAPDDVQA